MPIYQFSCEGCGEEFERYLPLRGNANPDCECGGKTERIWALGVKTKGSDVYPYITKNITGKPIEVTSPAHLKSLCKQYNVVNRDDKAWIEKTHNGCDRFGRPIYKEGSGRGLPGAW